MELIEDTYLKSYHGDKNIIVITNFGTASAAEYVAASIQEMGILILGERTMGCAGDTMIIDLGNGWQLPLSCNHNLTPEGKEIMGVGIIPNMEVPITAEEVAAGTDSQLNKAIEILD